MRVLVTGGTGFVGAGVVAEALASSHVERVVTLGRSPTKVEHPKLVEVVTPDLGDLSGVASRLAGLDACFWCLGTSSSGMDEASYTRVTYAYTMHAAELLAKTDPGLFFCFLSGSGADGKSMWARVKKRTEQELRTAGLDGVTVFRPAYIRGDHDARLRGFVYRLAYSVMTPFSPIFRALGGATSNTEIGRAMIVAARRRLDGRILDSREINRLAADSGS